MIVKTSELTGPALDWAVARADNLYNVVIRDGRLGIPGWRGGDYNGHHTFDGYHPSANWAQGGPIIEREKISTWDADGVGCGYAWGAHKTVSCNHQYEQRAIPH